MIFTDEKTIRNQTINKIKIEADRRLMVIISPINNREMLELIPACEKFYRWNGICDGCGCDASFTINKKHYCRECKQNLMKI